jgi:hypothetical protein
MKRKHNKDIPMRDALENCRQQQAHDRLPREESPSEPDSDDEDFDIFFE